MLVEIFRVDPAALCGDDVESTLDPIRVVAIQYHRWDNQMEQKMIEAMAWFDISLPNMSQLMRDRIKDNTHRTAIFELRD